VNASIGTIGPGHSAEASEIPRHVPGEVPPGKLADSEAAEAGDADQSLTTSSHTSAWQGNSSGQ
jgi:hypothetical protein